MSGLIGRTLVESVGLEQRARVRVLVSRGGLGAGGGWVGQRARERTERDRPDLRSE